MADAIPFSSAGPDAHQHDALQAAAEDSVVAAAFGTSQEVTDTDAPAAAGAGVPAPPGTEPAEPLVLLPPPQLPVADLIGLRFSLQHLRLVGYGLLAAWLAELINLLSSPGLFEIAARLQSISQLLDLSPILLVGIGLVAFQGGLRRSWLEVAALPLVLALLPLLSGFHFFLAPVSVANVVTLTQKQQQIGSDQLERIDRQMDRATQILAESDSIDALLEGLQRIPGLQVRVPANAAVTEARQQVRRSLQKERDRIKERITTNLANSRNAFQRRAAINTALAVLMGLLLWGLHHGAMAEMEQSIPYLEWVLAGGASVDNPLALEQLIVFQRACVALGWFTLVERSVRFVRRRLGMADVVQQELDQGPPSPDPMAPPWTGASIGAGSSSSQRFRPLRPFQTPLPSDQVSSAMETGAPESEDDRDPSQELAQDAWLRKQRLQQERDLRRYHQRASLMEEPEEKRELREGNEEQLQDLDELRSRQPAPPRGWQRLLGRWQGDDGGSDLPEVRFPARDLVKEQRRQQHDLDRYRRQAGRLDESEELNLLQEGNVELLRELDELRSQPPPPPRGLRRLVHWVLTHR